MNKTSLLILSWSVYSDTSGFLERVSIWDSPAARSNKKNQQVNHNKGHGCCQGWSTSNRPLLHQTPASHRININLPVKILKLHSHLTADRTTMVLLRHVSLLTRSVTDQKPHFNEFYAHKCSKRLLNYPTDCAYYTLNQYNPPRHKNSFYDYFCLKYY